MSKIFISYRRLDSNHVTGRIYDCLASRFGKNIIFRDVESIPLGIDFRDCIKDELDNCYLLLAIIGEKWLKITDSEGNRRLEKKDDPVRVEIEIALERDIPVIPLLIDDTPMPEESELPESLKKLVYRNKVNIRPEPDFRNDVNRLIRSINYHLKLDERIISQESYNDHLSNNIWQGINRLVPSLIGLIRSNKVEEARIIRSRLLDKLESKISIYLEDNLQENAFGENRHLDLSILQAKKAVARSKKRKVKQKTPISNLNTVYNSKKNKGRILLLGEPGSGKTISLLLLAQDLAQEAKKDDKKCIPVIFDAKNWEPKYRNIINWFCDQIRANYLDINLSIFKYLLELDQINIFIDGLDEIDSSLEEKFIHKLNDFLVSSNQKVIVFCRTNEYFRFKKKLNKLNNAYEILPPGNKEIFNYVSDIGSEHIWEKIISNNDLLELAQRPFFLNIMLPIVGEHNIANETDLVQFYIEQRLNEYQSLNLPKDTCKYQKDEIVAWLKNIALSIPNNKFFIEEINAQWLNKFQYILYRIILSLLLGLCFLIPMFIYASYSNFYFYSFPQLFQESLKAVLPFFFIVFSLGLILGGWLTNSVINKIFAPNSLLRFPRKEDFFRGIVFSFLLFIAYWITTVPVMNIFGNTIGNYYTITISKLMSFLGATDFEISRFLYESSLIDSNISTNSFTLKWLQSLFSVLAGFIIGSKAFIEVRYYPNQGFWEAFKSFLATIALTFPFTTLLGRSIEKYSFGYVSGWSDSVITGLSYAAMLGMTTGGLFCLQHISLRLTLWFSDFSPLNFKRFLRHAAALKFIGRMGGEYYFIHNYIWKYFSKYNVKPYEDR